MIPDHDNSGSAFPHGPETGISVRDFFLAAALTGIAGQMDTSGEDAEAIVEHASALADEVMQQREYPRSVRIDLAAKTSAAQRDAAQATAALDKLVKAIPTPNLGEPEQPFLLREALAEAREVLDPGIPF